MWLKKYKTFLTRQLASAWTCVRVNTLILFEFQILPPVHLSCCTHFKAVSHAHYQWWPTQLILKKCKVKLNVNFSLHVFCFRELSWEITESKPFYQDMLMKHEWKIISANECFLPSTVEHVGSFMFISCACSLCLFCDFLLFI